MLSVEDRLSILRSLDLVGESKAIGYLPIATVENLLDTSIESIRYLYENKGLSIVVFGEDRTCMKSGAIFIFDEQMMLAMIDRFKEIIIRRGWKLELEYVIEKIAVAWYESNDPITQFIRAIYGDVAS